MKLILTRHGETVENKKKIMQGHLPGRLSRLGKEQAKKLALRLKNEKIDAIYSSDLKRASDTAREIAKFHQGIPFILEQKLREVDLGAYTGKSRAEIDWNRRPKGIETRASMRKRVKKLLDWVYMKHPFGTVLFVGHNGINKALMSIIFNKAAKDMDKIPKLLNTGVSIFEIKENKKHIVHLLNSVEHLE